MTISSMIQPDKRNVFFQIIEYSVYRFYTSLKEGHGDIGDGKQCFKLKGRGVNLYSKNDFLEYNDLDELSFDGICLELYSLSKRTPNWDIDRLFAYKSEIVDNLANILESSSVNELELYISDTKTANFIFTFLMTFEEEVLADKKLSKVNIESSQEEDVHLHKKNEPQDALKLLQIEFLERFQTLENRINNLETENKRLESKEKDDQDRIILLEASLKKIEKLEEQLESLQKSRKKELTEAFDALEDKLGAVSDQLSNVNQGSYNKESMHEFYTRIDQVEKQIIDIKDEYVKEDALQSFSKQLEKLNKEITFITDDHGNELKKVDLRFTKIKGERLELRDKMNLIEEEAKEKFDDLDTKLQNEIEVVHNVSDEMTKRQQELHTILREEVSSNKNYIEKIAENIDTSFKELKDKQHDLFITVNEVKKKKQENQNSYSDKNIPQQKNEVTSTILPEGETFSNQYVDIFYAEPDGNGFLTNLSSRKLTNKHVYKVMVLDENTADFEFVDEEDAKKTLNMNLAMMFDEYMYDNGTRGPKINLNSYGEAKKVRGLNAWRVSRKAIVNRS